jgi:hypothetical protein
LATAAEDVSGTIGRYDPQSDLVEEAEATLRVVGYVVQAIRDAHAGGTPGDAG